MPIFASPDDFQEHKKYVLLLKKALQVVKPGVEKKFLYFKQYPFGAKKLQLVLVDFDLNCATILAKTGHKPTAEGTVTLTETDELNFEVKKGSLKRIRLKKYFVTMGGGIKAVFVPPGEVDDEGEGEGSVVVEGQLPPPTAEPPPPPPDQPNEQAPVPPINKQMEKKLEFEENEFKRRQLTARIEELQKKVFPNSVQALKKQVLEKASALGVENKFAEANQLLDQLAAKVVPPPNYPAPKPPIKPPSSEAPKPPAPSPKLSAYMNTTKEWRVAKKTAGDGVFALKKAIFAACDPELKDAVKAKIDQLNSILAVMDDAIIARIQEAASEGDEDRQAEKNKALVQLATKQQADLRNHPLAAVADNNPFGKFTICSPVETVLTKITTSFAA